eukprot:1614203-Prymnesium_polylepis.1
MREVADEAESVGDVGAQAHNSDAFWPPPRELLQRVTLEVLSLHNLPKVRSKPRAARRCPACD